VSGNIPLTPMTRMKRAKSPRHEPAPRSIETRAAARRW
jgi:hypothetical protein